MALDSKNTLHIRCGSDIEVALRDAGFEGDFLDFSDPFCQGPVHDLPLGEFIDERANFISGAYHLPVGEVKAREQARYDALRQAAAYDDIILWFEHDHFDQLILAYLLKHLHDYRDMPPVELVCVHDYPVLPRFTGLGQLGPKDLASVWETRTEVGTEQMALGTEVWQALTADSPKALADLVKAGTPAVPTMREALDRHLDELPSTRHGLSLTETLSLRILAEKNRITAGAMFGQLMLRYEPLPYLGDLMYWFELERLVEGGAARVEKDADNWRDKTLSLTDLGERILMTEEDWLDHMPGARFVGGMEITSGQPHWRRDTKGRVVLKS
ncbi:DUF1835 domain-containing protein [Kordiimonas aestuarii]|uniref:DUF1835 domain-containing protein n=1 Tax=Kordiimonas aestuarii TaxID=1005925 RepID=UPI0021D147D3|nr:DUF1835 domain-containing protein [Kordiimonas aestuarii]